MMLQFKAVAAGSDPQMRLPVATIEAAPSLTVEAGSAESENGQTTDSEGGGAQKAWAVEAVVGLFCTMEEVTVTGDVIPLHLYGPDGRRNSPQSGVSPGSGVDGCSLLSETLSSLVSGKIAVVRRGSCPFKQKCGHLLKAGATACVVANNEGAGAAFTMAGLENADSHPDNVLPIPCVMVAEDSLPLLDGGAGQDAVRASVIQSHPPSFHQDPEG